MNVSPGDKTSARALAGPAALIAVLTLGAYLPALSADFIWDDDWWVTNNAAVQSWGGIWRLWSDPSVNQQYYPLTSTSFWLDCRIWGLNPFGYHLTNVLLHAANAVGLWLVLRALRVPGAWVSAAVFALHPVNVETAAWITERKNALSGLFFFFALLTYLRYVTVPTRRSYFSSLVLYLGALLSKTVTCVFPAVVVILIWWQRGRLRWRDISALIPFLLLGAAAGTMTAWIEIEHAGAAGDPWELNWLQRCQLAGRALWFYALELVWPARLMFVYPRWQLDAHAVWPYVYPIAALTVAAVLWSCRQRIGRGPLAAVAVYTVVLFPALGFFRVFFVRYSYVQDHFQYLASGALIALFVAIAARAGRSLGLRRAAACAPPAIVILLLGALTWNRAHAFRNSETLWRDSLTKNFDAWLPHNNLGIILAERGLYADAVEHYEHALRLEPSYPETYFNYGHALIDLGRLDEGLAMLGAGLERNSEFASVHYTIGYHLQQQGRLDESIDAYRAALAVDPRHRKAHFALGETLLKASRYAEAQGHYRRAVERNSPFASDYNNLAGVLLKNGEAAEAERLYRKAIEMDSDYADAHFNLGKLLHARGDSEGAILEFEAAARAGSERPEVYYNLGTMLQQIGRAEEAARHLARAVELRPGWADAHHNLAIAYYHVGDYASSWAHVRHAERLGKSMSPAFLEALASRMPAPDSGAENATGGRAGNSGQNAQPQNHHEQ